MADRSRALASCIDVSIVIVTWRSRAVLLPCLESLLQQQDFGELEVIVVDNASADGTLELLSTEFPWVRVVANTANRGLAAANNQGLLASRGEVIVISNPDVCFEPTAIREFAHVLSRRPRAAFVVPQVRLSDGTLQSTAGDLPTLMEGILGRQAAHQLARPGRTDGFCWDGWAHDEERLVGRAGDVCYAVRRAAVAELGLQDERFPLDWEAVDWSARVRQLGWEIWFAPSVRISHQLGSSTGQASQMRLVLSTQMGMYRYFSKRHGPAFRPVLMGIFAARAAAKLLAVALGLPVHERSRESQRVRNDATGTS